MGGPIPFVHDNLYMCHSTCDVPTINSYPGWIKMEFVTVVDYLKEIKTWLDANPNEVVSLLLTNGITDGVYQNITQYGQAMEDSGLAAYAFTPGSNFSDASWPTLGQLIATGKRLVMFMGKSFFHYFN